jgi:hypothetical protein
MYSTVHTTYRNNGHGKIKEWITNHTISFLYKWCRLAGVLVYTQLEVLVIVQVLAPALGVCSRSIKSITVHTPESTYQYVNGDAFANPKTPLGRGTISIYFNYVHANISNC